MRHHILPTLAALLLLPLIVLNLFSGTVSIPAPEVISILLGSEASHTAWTYIVLEGRLPSALTAALCGAALSAAGLLLQTTFRNPLAGPSILGVTNGASLGVGIVMLLLGGTVQTTLMGTHLHLAGILATTSAALLGSLLIIALLLLLSSLVRDNLMLLIVGIMVGYLTSSLISLLNLFATSDNLFTYVLWGMGSFSGVSLRQLPYFAAPVLSALCASLLLVKPLNALLLGDAYAENLGFSLRRMRTLLLCTTGLLTAAATAFCGPVAFLGLATPHIARLLCNTDDHRILLPTTIIAGSDIALLCNLLCQLPPETILPLNAVTPLIGAPVILYVILCRRR